MPPKVAAMLQVLIDRGQLIVAAGASRLTARRRAAWTSCSPADARSAPAHVVNCTGPSGDLSRIAIPLIADLRRRGTLVPDALGLGLETDDCAVLDEQGRVSTWLYALGPLTRPAWWEITSVPEIAVQVDRLVEALTAAPATRPVLAEAFVDLGAGI